MRTFVISLQDEKNRRKLAMDEARKYDLQIEFFDAVDGKKLGHDALHAHYDPAQNKRYFKRPLASGEIACYLSHIELWKKIAQDPADCALILEDDFEFADDPTPFFRQLANKNLTSLMIKIDGNPRQKNLSVVDQLGGTKLALVDIIPARTTGYLIGKNAAKTLLKSRNMFFRTVDNDIKHHWEYDVPVLVAVPQLVREREGNTSNLDAARNAQRAGGAFNRLFKNLLYQARFKLGLLLHPKVTVARIRELLSA